MQTILSSLVIAFVAGVAVDSAAIDQESKAVGKRDLWQYTGLMGGYYGGPGIQERSFSGAWSSGHDAEQHQPQQHHYQLSQDHFQHMQQLLAAPAVHEWHSEGGYGGDQGHQEAWKPASFGTARSLHGISTHSVESNEKGHSKKDDESYEVVQEGGHEGGNQEGRDGGHDGGHETHIEEHEHAHHHHHHNHVKVIEIPKPYPVHVEKPYPVYVEKPFIVEKHVPIKLYITKKYHDHKH
ncbi:histidine-rich glycoprotein-like [Uranotaenia lowii]|uniref:histidine-rich glycoprotein-like n=1 Tax=Uranotaenia lowii TaxID=190385 RepID=UPI0024792B1D|nr:histidine-rich glycoprotein-like [Uranotaenia lowii]